MADANEAELLADGMEGEESGRSIDGGRESGLVLPPVDITQPLWDQSTFLGRLNYFVRVTNPLLLFKTRDEYKRAQELVLLAR